MKLFRVRDIAENYLSCAEGFQKRAEVFSNVRQQQLTIIRSHKAEPGATICNFKHVVGNSADVYASRPDPGQA